MSSSTGKAIGAARGSEYWYKFPEEIRIAQEDPEHPGHASHMARVSLENPEFQLLLHLIRTLGWETGSIGYYYRDPPNAPIPTAATAKRRITAARIVNAEWKAAKDKRYPIMVPIVRTDDPIMAENIENAARAADPPLVLARRFLAACKTMDPAMAAASVGMRLADANEAVKLLSAAPEIQAAVNAREIPLDVASRVAKKGQKEGAKALAAATSPTTGKVNAKALKAKAAEEHEPRPKARPVKLIHAMAQALPEGTSTAVVALLEWIGGDNSALNGHPKLRAAAEKAGWKASAAAAESE